MTQPKETSTTTDPAPKIDPNQLVLDLLMGGVGAKITEQITARFHRLVTITVAIVGLVIAIAGGCLIEEVRRPIRRQARQMAAEMKTASAEITEGTAEIRRQVASFKDEMVPEFKKQIKRLTELESKAAFPNKCSTYPTTQQIRQVYKYSLGLEITTQETLDGIANTAKQMNICDTKTITEILDDKRTQTQIDVLYSEIFERPADPWARLLWGVRLRRAYSIEEARQIASMSPEVLQKRRIAADPPKKP